jgi:hypothetical protein
MSAAPDAARPFSAPALLDAGDDPSLDPLAVRVLVWCWRNLPLDGRHHSVKADALGLWLRVKRERIAAALDALVAGGYLSAGPRGYGNARTVRLIPERRNGGHG